MAIIGQNIDTRLPDVFSNYFNSLLRRRVKRFVKTMIMSIKFLNLIKCLFVITLNQLLLFRTRKLSVLLVSKIKEWLILKWVL
ncbi:hypothetical protein CWC25_12770 [Pseudoalteromonas sp. S4389]|nr:hypothetical protein CWC25_12770 [Pseudoalteromonas sp. S4389]